MLGPLSLVPGMSNLESLACCVACMAATTAGVVLCRKYCLPPHPTECLPICAECYFKMGWHQHHPFRLDIEVLTVDMLPPKKKYAVDISTSRSESTVLSEDHKTFNSMGSVKVRSCDKYVYFQVYESGTKLNKADYGELYMDVDDLLIKNEWPIMNKTIAMIKQNGKLGARLNCNFYFSCDINGDTGIVAVNSMALRKSREFNAKGPEKKVKTDVTKMKALDKIRFISRALDGPIRLVGATEKMKYMRVREVKPGKFELHLFPWSDGADAGSAAPGEPSATSQPEEAFSALGIVNIIKDSQDADSFTMKIVAKKKASLVSKEKEVESFWNFRRVDRPREVWTDGFFDFLERLRAYKQAKQNNTIEVLEEQIKDENRLITEAASQNPLWEKEIKWSSSSPNHKSKKGKVANDGNEEEDDNENTNLLREDSQTSIPDTKNGKPKGNTDDDFEKKYYADNQINAAIQGESEAQKRINQRQQLKAASKAKSDPAAAAQAEQVAFAKQLKAGPPPANSSGVALRPSEASVQAKNATLSKFLARQSVSDSKNTPLLNVQAANKSSFANAPPLNLNVDEEEALDGLFDD